MLPTGEKLARVGFVNTLRPPCPVWALLLSTIVKYDSILPKSRKGELAKMSVFATTLDGIDVLNLDAEFRRSMNWPIDVIQITVGVDSSHRMSRPFGEFMVGLIGGWTNRCMHICLAGAVSEEVVLNLVACGADVITIPHELASDVTIALIRKTGALVGMKIGIDDWKSVRSVPVDVIYMDCISESGLETPRKLRDACDRYVDAIRSDVPGAVIAIRLSVEMLTSPLLIKLSGVDLLTLDLFSVTDIEPIVRNLTLCSEATIHPTLARAIPSGLAIARDHDRLLRLFENIDARLPFIRQPVIRSRAGETTR